MYHERETSSSNDGEGQSTQANASSDGSIDKRYIHKKQLTKMIKYLMDRYKMDMVEALDFTQVLIDWAEMGDPMMRRFRKMMMKDHDTRKDYDLDEGPTASQKIAKELLRSQNRLRLEQVICLRMAETFLKW